MTTVHRFLVGNSKHMSSLSDNSVHLIVTSPPYWTLKDYGVKNQTGFGQSYQKYISDLHSVWQECYRVLCPGSRLCINIGDFYSKRQKTNTYSVIPINVDIIQSCRQLGFLYMGSIIWQKISSSNPSGGGTFMGSYPYPRNGLISYDFEYVAIFKKPGKSLKPTTEQKVISKLSKDEWQRYFTGHWQFPGVRQKNHPAMFPEELPARLIKMFSFVGETVLDPFAGSGTTCVAADRLRRNSIGVDINNGYIKTLRKRFKSNA